jgi:hypothetical protein
MKRDTKMTRAEVMAEVEWMLDFGMHPAFICTQIERSIQAVTRMAYRAKNRRVFTAFNGEQSRERYSREKELA